MHLTIEELIDLAERTSEQSRHPHLQSCGLCRHQLAELQSALSAAAEVEVPEPSPLFWKHLSERIHDAVAAESGPPSRFTNRGWTFPSWRGLAVAGAAAAVTIAIYLTIPQSVGQPAGVQEISAVPPEAEAFPLSDDDPSLALVADLTSQLDADAFDETGWSSHAGAVDEAVVNLTEDERVELQRLLNEELAKS